MGGGVADGGGGLCVQQGQVGRQRGGDVPAGVARVVAFKRLRGFVSRGSVRGWSFSKEEWRGREGGREVGLHRSR